jgi:hypothetical protein
MPCCVKLPRKRYSKILAIKNERWREVAGTLERDIPHGSAIKSMNFRRRRAGGINTWRF